MTTGLIITVDQLLVVIAQVLATVARLLQHVQVLFVLVPWSGEEEIEHDTSHESNDGDRAVEPDEVGVIAGWQEGLSKCCGDGVGAVVEPWKYVLGWT